MRWSIEAKGLITAVGLDFRTGLGQLLQGMTDPQARYGLAMPDIPQFRKQEAAVPTWVVAALRINWLFVGPDGAVTLVEPGGAASPP